MFEQLYKKPFSIRRQLSAPILEDRLRYLVHREEQGTARSVLRTIANYQLILTKYLSLEKNRMITFEEIKTAAHRWALHEMRRFFFKKIIYHLGRLRFIKHAKNWLRFLGRLEMPAPPPSPQQVVEFVDYMRKEKDLSEITISDRCKMLKEFFSHTKELPGRFLARLTPAYLDDFLIQKLQEGGCARRTIQTFVSNLRVFLRYAESRGWCRSGISDSIHAPRVYQHATLPWSPSWEDVRRLLKTTKGNRPSDIRARAILLLLTVYGMRQSEIGQLRLEDFDWERETFRLKRSKNGPTHQFPLSQIVGQALVRYIKKARPRSTHREVFLTLDAPFRPVTGFYAIVALRWKSLNVSIQHRGTHSLRHACATRLINQGVSLKTIADQLGHRDLETTRIYAKVDLPRLREVANFNLGGLS